MEGGYTQRLYVDDWKPARSQRLLMGRLFLHAVNFLFFPSLCASQSRFAHVFSLFPGQRNHVLHIDVIRFMTDGPRSPSLSHGAR